MHRCEENRAVADGRSSYALVGASIVLGDRVQDHHAIMVHGDTICEVMPVAALPESVPTILFDGGYLAPGFVDIHVHGAHGAGFDDAASDAVRTASRALLTSGVTTIVPTLASMPIDRLFLALDALDAARSEPQLPRLAGAHLEGPYFAPEQSGAQNPGDLRLPNDGSFEQIAERFTEVRMMSLAPELPGAPEIITQLVDRGVVAAAGHTNGTAEDLRRGQDAGITHVTHIYSGQSTTTRRGPWRVPGMLEATLASTDLTVEMIADGKHLPTELMVIADRALRGRLCLVSDATPGAGLAEGSRYSVGATDCVVENGVGMTQDRASFGGSVTMLPQMVPRVREQLGLSVPDVVAMATSLPARAAGLTRVGALVPGYFADLVHLDDRLHVRAVVSAGKLLSTDTDSPL